MKNKVKARLRYSVYARFDSIGWDGCGGFQTLKAARAAAEALLSPSDASEEPATEAAIYDEATGRVRALYNTDGADVFTPEALARSCPVEFWNVGAVYALETASLSAV